MSSTPKQRGTDRIDSNSSTKQTIRQSIRFSLVGLLNTAIDFFLFIAMTTYGHTSVFLAQTVSYAISVVNSYLVNYSHLSFA
nr:GtrA family protein [Bacilli bacterium]